MSQSQTPTCTIKVKQPSHSMMITLLQITLRTASQNKDQTQNPHKTLELQQTMNQQQEDHISSNIGIVTNILIFCSGSECINLFVCLNLKRKILYATSSKLFTFRFSTLPPCSLNLEKIIEMNQVNSLYSIDYLCECCKPCLSIYTFVNTF